MALNVAGMSIAWRRYTATRERGLPTAADIVLLCYFDDVQNSTPRAIGSVSMTDAHGKSMDISSLLIANFAGRRLEPGVLGALTRHDGQ